MQNKGNPMGTRISSQAPVSQTRQVRVFISSTFRDMHEERDYLVKHIFPELRLRCRQRQVEFVEVDLRWGVTEEQAERGEVLPICLEEIENCRPYFIGLLGERYGWVPDYIPPELIETQPWLADRKEHSITELEILHGVLNNPEMANRTYFYFRNSGYAQGISLDHRSDYISEDQASRAKVEALKERIRKSGLRVREDYPDPEAAGNLILDDLWDAIDKTYPAGSEPDPLIREAAEHEIFAASRARVYIGRQEYFDRLDAHIESDNPPLVLLSESGMGKSALLSNWAIRCREAYPEDFIILHFIGSTPQSADYVAVLRRIMEEIKRRYELAEDIPVAPDKLREEFPLWLARASAHGRMILVLDGLNQLEDRDNAPDLGWLPEYFPPNIRVILSTLPGRSLDAIKKRNWAAYQVKPLEPEERRSIIRQYLGQYRKSLSPAPLERIVTTPQTANPLFLRALLDELRIFGVYEELDNRINYYLGASTIPDLYQRILERLEEDYEKERPGMVGEVLSLLWAARRGLYESELLELLGSSEGPLPRYIWSPLYLAIGESLVSRSGLLNFFHDFLRKAVENRYLRNSELKGKAHLRLADYFDGRETDDRKVDELPWQLSQTESWKRLKKCITEMDIFLRQNTDEKQYELMGYWLAIGGRFDMVEAYNASLEQYEQSNPSEEELAYRLNKVAFFLRLNANYDGAEPLYRRALTIREKVLGPEHPDTATNLHNLAVLLKSKGDYDGAEPLYRRALTIYEKVLGPEHPNTAGSLYCLGELLYSKGDYDGTEPLYRRALTIREKVLGPEHPDTAISLNCIALLLYSKGDYDGAEPLYRRALAICEKVLGPEHPYTATSLHNLAESLYSKGDYDGAEPLYRRALTIYEKVFGPDHPYTAISLHNFGLLLKSKGDYDGAEPLYRRALAISEKVLGPEHPDTVTSLNNLAVLLDNKGDYDGAEPLYRRALEISEKVLGPEHPDTALSLNNLAVLLYNKGDYGGAEPLYRRALEIREKALGPEHPYTALNLNNLAVLLDNKGDYGGAEPLYRRALEIREKVLGSEHPDTVTSLNNLALLLYSKGDYDGAEPLYRRALTIYEKVLGPEHPYTATSLNSLALLLRNMGNHGESALMFKRLIVNFEKKEVSDPSILNNMALSHNELAFHTYVPDKNWKDAEYHYGQAIELFTRVSNPIESANAELNLQTMFRDSGQEMDRKRIEELLRILEEAESPKAEKARNLLAGLT